MIDEEKENGKERLRLGMGEHLVPALLVRGPHSASGSVTQIVT